MGDGPRRTFTPAPAGPQYMRALERANRVRLARAELKRKVAEDELDVADVILDCPWEAESMAVADLLLSQRRWGQTRCRKLLAQIPMSEKKTIGSMTDRSRRVLAELLRSARSDRYDDIHDPARLGSYTDTVGDRSLALLDELSEVGLKCDALSADLDSETDRRNALIAAASEAGASQKTIAEAARITAARVHQILLSRASWAMSSD